MGFKKLIFFLLLLIPGMAWSQAPRTYTSSEILLQLKKLNVLGSVLYLAAHPDDENTRLLSWLANEKLYRTAYLSITRGDGGQNLIGDEQGVELGLIRTQELMAARRIDGAEQFFTCAYDFGYSKSPEEAMVFWDREKVLSDVVWVIRSFRPDIIITRFPTTGEGGHGHHTASAILAEEAYEAAGDPKRFPEQLTNGVEVWKPKRLLWNTFNFGSANTQRDDQFKIDVGAFNPLIGKSYGELAALSRSQHKSQGFGVPSQRGSVLEYFATIKGQKPTYSLMEGIDISWNRINMAQTEQLIEGLISSYNFNDPSASVIDLVELYSFISASDADNNWKKQKLLEIKNIIAICAGLYLEATTANSFAVQGDSIKINTTVNCRSAAKISSAVVRCLGKEFSLPALQPNINAQVTIPALIETGEAITQPYWLEEPMESLGRFNVKNRMLVGKPWNDPISARFTLDISGSKFEYEVPVQYKFTDPVKGEILQPLIVTAPVSVAARDPLALKSGKGKPDIRAEVNALQAITLEPGKLRGKKSMPFINVAADTSIGLLKNERKLIRLSMREKGDNQLFARQGDRVFEKELRTISYDHIPAINYHRPAIVNMIDVSLDKGRIKRVGYIRGAGDKVADAMMQMGYEVEFLNEEDLIMPRLSRFDALVTGVRAYNTNDWLYARNNVLMEYVREGGNLIVQYNTNSWAGPSKGNFGPYPFVISRNRVTDERSAVKFLVPDHEVLNKPNKITQQDFEGWIQERSIYHADKIDSRYQKVLSFADAGEPEQDGSLIIGKYGKGNFVYTGLVFFRQLPAGVTGAYRLLANMLALSVNQP